MNRKHGHGRSGLPRRARTGTIYRSTRREFLIAAAAWSALGWMGAVFAQSKPPVLIGWLSSYSRESAAPRLAAFKEGMAALGWKEGVNYVLEERWAEDQPGRRPALARELAAKRPAVIVATTAGPALDAARAAPNTPIVVTDPDPVATGLAKNLARPGGMITGVASLRDDLTEKYVELLLAAAPKLKRVGFLANPNSRLHQQYVDAARRSAAQYAVDARFADAGKAGEIEPAVSRLAKEGAQALIVLSPALFLAERRQIVKLALAHRWPLIADQIEVPEEGVLLSYGANPAISYRRLAYYVDRILKGAKPADLPIEQPTKFELVINLKTAKALGLTIPQNLLFRADRVIE